MQRSGVGTPESAAAREPPRPVAREARSLPHLTWEFLVTGSYANAGAWDV